MRKRKRELDRKYHKRKREERLAANIPRKKTEPLTAEEEAEEGTGSRSRPSGPSSASAAPINTSGMNTIP